MATIPAPLVGQGEVLPAWTDATRLPLGVDSLAIFLVREDGRHRIGMVWDELVLSDWQGKQALRRTYRTTNSVFGNHMETAFSTWPDLHPLSDRTEAPLIQSHTIFRPDSIVGWSQIRDSARVEFSRSTDGVLWDGQAVDLMIRSADLGPGFRKAFEAFVPAESALRPMEAWVTGTDSMAGADGRPEEVWVVELRFDTLNSTLWIGKQTRALHRQVIHLAEGIDIETDRSYEQP